MISRIKIARILLMTATLALGSIYGYYYGREWVAKWAFAHQTEFGIDELILIAIPQADLTHQNAHLASEGEFEWQGQMVDVLHREVRSDTLFIYGFRDVAETNLKREVSWLYPDATRPDPLPDSAANRAKWFSPFILPESTIMSWMTWLFLPTPRPVFADATPYIRHRKPDVPAPPPDLPDSIASNESVATALDYLHFCTI